MFLSGKNGFLFSFFVLVQAVDLSVDLSAASATAEQWNIIIHIFFSRKAAIVSIDIFFQYH